MTPLPVRLVVLISAVIVNATGCTAFTQSFRRTLTRPRENHPSKGLFVEPSENDTKFGIPLDSLPSKDIIMENALEGEFGERGEQYVIAQFSLLFFIAIGNVPFIGDTITNFLGPFLILSGLFIVYRSAADLNDSLTPWPVPVKSGSLINSGIYSYVRHPMYSGLLLGMVGLAIVSDSVMRMLLTCALYCVLDIKSKFEEERLGDIYGAEYENYQQEVKGKFVPADWTKIWD